MGPKKNEGGWRRCFICYKAATRVKLKKIAAKRLSAEKLNATDLRIVKMCRMDTSGIDLMLMLQQDSASSSNDLIFSQYDQQNALATSTLAFNVPLINTNTAICC